MAKTISSAVKKGIKKLETAKKDKNKERRTYSSELIKIKTIINYISNIQEIFEEGDLFPIIDSTFSDYMKMKLKIEKLKIGSRMMDKLGIRMVQSMRDELKQEEREIKKELGLDIKILLQIKNKKLKDIDIEYFKEDPLSVSFFYFYQNIIKKIRKPHENPTIQQDNAYGAMQGTKKVPIQLGKYFKTGSLKSIVPDKELPKEEDYYPQKWINASTIVFKEIEQEILEKEKELERKIETTTKKIEELQGNIIKQKENSQNIKKTILKELINSLLEKGTEEKKIIRITKESLQIKVNTIDNIKTAIDTSEKKQLNRLKKELLTIKNIFDKKEEKEKREGADEKRKRAKMEKQLNGIWAEAIQFCDLDTLEEYRSVIEDKDKNPEFIRIALKDFEDRIIKIKEIQEDAEIRYKRFEKKYDNRKKKREGKGKGLLDSQLKDNKKQAKNWLKEIKKELDIKKSEELLGKISNANEAQMNMLNLMGTATKIHMAIASPTAIKDPGKKKIAIFLFTKDPTYPNLLKEYTKKWDSENDPTFSDAIQLNKLLGSLLIQNYKHFTPDAILDYILEIKQERYRKIDTAIKNHLKELDIKEDPIETQLNELKERFDLTTETSLRLWIRRIDALLAELGGGYNDGKENVAKLIAGKSVTIKDNHRLGTSLMRLAKIHIYGPLERQVSAYTFKLEKQERNALKDNMELLKCYNHIYRGN